MPVPVRVYKDLDLDLTPHPVTGALSTLNDADAVRRSVRQLVLTANFERPHRPWIGSPVQNSLFGLANLVTAQQIKSGIETVVAAHEKRAEIQNVEVDLNNDRNGYDCVITFSVKNIPAPIELTLFLKRTR